MENTFLPGTVRERIADLMKYHKVSQTDLALKIGCGDSLLSRFLTGKTDKLGDENIIRIARAFNVSTDFLLGITNVPDKKNYAIRGVQLRKHSKAREKRYSFGYAVSFIFACYQILWTFPKSLYLCSRYLLLAYG